MVLLGKNYKAEWQGVVELRTRVRRLNLSFGLNMDGIGSFFCSANRLNIISEKLITPVENRPLPM